MSSNWGDFNGDGKTDYVDYKIFSTQVDPYSGEYQGNVSSSSSGCSGIIWLLIIVFVSIGAIVANPMIGVVVALFCVFIYGNYKRNAKIEAEKEAGKGAVYPRSTNEYGVVICPKCSTRQKADNRRCCNCGIPFAYIE